MQDIDPRFKAAKERSKKRKRSGAMGLALGLGGFLVLAGGGAALYFLLPDSPTGDDDSTLTVEVQDIEIDDTPTAYVSPYIDLAGDPLVLKLDTGGAQTTLPPPFELDGTRVTGEVVLISDIMIAREETLNTTVPTRREDFAFYQDQGDGQNQNDTGADAASNSIRVTPDHLRPPGASELIIRISQPRESLSDVLADQALLEGSLPAFEASLAGVADIGGALQSGAILAMRYMQDGLFRQPLQLSLYSNDGYLASAALDDSLEAVQPAADPWVDIDLRAVRPVNASQGAGQKYRLMDAIYSTGLRNGMPSALLGETIVLMSKSFDTDAFAQPGDRLTLAYTTDTTLGSTAQILFAEVDRQGTDLKCYVAQAQNDDELRCWNKTAGAPQSGPRLRKGLSPPVAGVKRSGFGPRRDPKTGTVEQHDGVDWAAPVGSDVRAAIDGTVASVSEDETYGLTIELSHSGGKSTFYGHLSRQTVSNGDRISAGQLIGAVGTSGATNIPHLHFEYREDGDPKDPYTHDAGGLAGEAVGALVDQIVKVESGGRACVKAATSSATGLGQFIESTWIRMMKTYRADLYASLDREDLLALRCDPTLSYEMITNLAREGEAYLSSRGHDVTAGRLYMAHFLGAGSAAKVLSADDAAPLDEVVGKRVVEANSFLKGKDVAYLKAWADRKMRGRGGAAAAPPIPTEIAEYQSIIDRMLTGG